MIRLAHKRTKFLILLPVMLAVSACGVFGGGGGGAVSPWFIGALGLLLLARRTRRRE